jgi:hypothetical protein
VSAFLDGICRVFSFGLVRNVRPAPVTPESALTTTWETLDRATDQGES